MDSLDLSNEKLIAIDSETTGLSDDDRAVGLGIATSQGSCYLPWGHGSCNTYTAPDVDRLLRSISPTAVVVAHNAQFDVEMLARAGVNLPVSQVEDTMTVAAIYDERVPSFSLDALSTLYLGRGKMDDQPLNDQLASLFGGKATTKAQVKNYWKAPGGSVGPYCRRDAELCRDLYLLLRPRLAEEDAEGHSLEEIYLVERALLPVLIRMHRTGIRVDMEAAVRLQAKLDGQLADANSKFIESFGSVNPRSSQQMAALLIDLGVPPSVIPRTKPSKMFPEGQYSVNKSFLDHLDHPLAQLSRDVRTLGHYAGTFVENYVLKNADADGIIHGRFHPLKKETEYGASAGTVSGRFSSSGGLNLQNIPAPDPDHPESQKHLMAAAIRGLFVPMHSDQQLLSADYGQIEFRFLAHYAGGALRRAYCDDPGIDFHDLVSKITGISRKPAKNMNFGMAYGMGSTLMAERLGVSIQEAQAMLREYHTRLPDVRALYEKTMRRAMTRGYIRTWRGRRRRFFEDPEGRFGKYKFTHKALNALLQGSAADLIKLAMLQVDSQLDHSQSQLHLTVHDELVLSVPRGAEGDRTVLMVKEAMENFKLTVPIMVDCEVGMDWGHTSAWKPGGDFGR